MDSELRLRSGVTLATEGFAGIAGPRAVCALQMFTARSMLKCGSELRFGVEKLTRDATIAWESSAASGIREWLCTIRGDPDFEFAWERVEAGRCGSWFMSRSRKVSIQVNVQF